MESLYSKWVQILRNSDQDGVKIKVSLTAIPGNRLARKEILNSHPASYLQSLMVIEMRLIFCHNFIEVILR